MPHELDAVRTILVQDIVGRSVEFIENAGSRIRDAGQRSGRTRKCDHGRGPGHS
ncbi:hypothetical protein NKJ90_05555 [Mesorhizobium sp. M0051]|uniref:hypothetical protein n=1 Tax=unclassified Mesorhizobium TaxID=325217 RepID=UPI0003CE5F6F|nr:hypothetical protein [Mesorhizobium sp. LNHC252B00]ESY63896.1 hypothetical protein X743_32240 [Mesorhizobium sp. LNHC252B00]